MIEVARAPDRLVLLRAGKEGVLLRASRLKHNRERDVIDEHTLFINVPFEDVIRVYEAARDQVLRPTAKAVNNSASL